MYGRCSRREFVRRLAALALGASFSGCTRPGPAPTAPTVAPIAARTSGRGVQVTFGAPCQSAARFLDRLLSGDSSWPESVELVPLEVEGRTLDCNVDAMHASGTAPDLCLESDIGLYDAARKGYHLALEPLMEAEGRLDLTDLYPRQIAQARYKDKLYALPYYSWCTLMFVNRDLFRAGGAPVPDGDWHWDEFRQIARALTNAGQKRWGCGIVRGWEYVEHIWQNGAEVFDADRTHCLLESPAAIEALEFWVDLARQDHVMPEATQVESFRDSFVLFCAGQLAMCELGSFDLTRPLLQESEIDWDLVNQPFQKHPASLVQTTYLAANARTGRPVEVWRAMSALLEPERLARLVQMVRGPAARRSVNARNPLALTRLDWGMVLKCLDDGRGIDSVPNAVRVNDLLYEMLYGPIERGGEVKQVVAEYVPKMNAALTSG